MEFPKNDIRDFTLATVTEAYNLGIAVNDNVSTGTNLSEFDNSFNNNFTQYIEQLQNLSMEHGTYVNVDWQNNQYMNSSRCENITLYLYYTNGETLYDENTIINLM
jgi:hypothetical protein